MAVPSPKKQQSRRSKKIIPEPMDCILDGPEDDPFNLAPSKVKKYVNVGLPRDEFEILNRVRAVTRAKTLTSVIRYALLVLATLVEAREGEGSGWVLCWVREGKARKIQLPKWI